MARPIAALSLIPLLFMTRLPTMEESGRIGFFSTVFKNYHPESTLEAVCRRTGYKMEPWDLPTHSYVLQNETWTVYVPSSYRPDRPYGLLVWISSGENGSIPRDWMPIMEKHRMIWIAADNSGNLRSQYGRRIPLAMDAVYNMTKLYTIDPDRITISGFSGGGRTASIAALNYPDIFPRGLFIAGVSYWEELPIPSQGNMDWVPGMAEPNSQSLALVKEKSRLVLVTGDKDINREQTKTYYQTWYKKHTNRTLYLQVPRMRHELPPAEWLDKALSFLDEPLSGS